MLTTETTETTLIDELLDLLWGSPQVSWRKANAGSSNTYLAVPLEKVKSWRDRWRERRVTPDG